MDEVAKIYVKFTYVLRHPHWKYWNPRKKLPSNLGKYQNFSQNKILVSYELGCLMLGEYWVRWLKGCNS
jgi:hypothetical protein